MFHQKYKVHTVQSNSDPDVFYTVWPWRSSYQTRTRPWEMDFCSCLAGQDGKVCWHRAAVWMHKRGEWQETS